MIWQDVRDEFAALDSVAGEEEMSITGGSAIAAESKVATSDG